MFLDLFARDFLKIQQALKVKQQMQADGKIRDNRKLPPIIKINMDFLIYGSMDIRKALEQN